MNGILRLAGAVLVMTMAATAEAAPGEWWEISAKMDMPGMPFAMPGQTNKVCLPKGGEADPSRTQGKDSNCKFTDVQTSGNTVKYKGTCVNNGETMNVVGETTHDSNSFKSSMKMTGKSHGEPMNMSMSSTGKRVGGSCDTEEMGRKAKAQGDEYRRQAELAQKQAEASNAKLCDVTDSDILLQTATHYMGPAPMCKNKSEYCKAVKQKASRDASAYEQLIAQDERQKKMADGQKVNADDFMIARLCNLDMASLKKTACKNSVHSGPQEFMDKNCSPAEAKEYREYARKREDCYGRGYTSSDKLKRCMAGKLSKEEEASDSCGRDYTSADQRRACRNLAKCGSDVCDDSPRSKDSAKIDSDTVLQGAKKLKGLFGF